MVVPTLEVVVKKYLRRVSYGFRAIIRINIRKTIYRLNPRGFEEMALGLSQTGLKGNVMI